jgi:hypothetical protein
MEEGKVQVQEVWGRERRLREDYQIQLKSLIKRKTETEGENGNEKTGSSILEMEKSFQVFTDF